MKKFNIFAVFLLLFTAVCVLLFPTASALAEPGIKADAALLVETANGQVLYGKNKDKPMSAGGFSKVMTLLLAVEAVENGKAALTDNVTASPAATGTLKAGDFRLNIAAGETLSFEDLMYCASLAGAGDACNIIAEHVAGSIDAFTALMNKEAVRLGCTGTHFTSPAGSENPEQLTTAWDQYLIFREAISHVLFMTIAGTLSYETSNASSAAHIIQNSNQMLIGSSPYYYKYCVAGRSGDAAEGFSLVSCAKNNDMTLISVVSDLGTAQPNDGTGEAQGYSETKNLFDWGFAGFSWQTVVDKNDMVTTEKVALANGTDEVPLRPADTVTLLMRTDLTEADYRKDIVLYGQAEGKTLTAPVREGDILGEMTVYLDGTPCAKTKLVAARDIALDTGAFIKTRLSATLSNFWVQLAAFILLLLIGGYIALVVRDRKIRREKKRLADEKKQRIIEERKKLYK